MIRSVDLIIKEGIAQPRSIDWNHVYTQWEWNEDKQRYYSTEWNFTNDLKWEKSIISKKNLDEINESKL